MFLWIKRIIIFGIMPILLAIISWPFIYSALNPEQQNIRQIKQLNTILTQSKKQLKSVANSAQKSASPILGHFIKQDYTPNIKTITAAQLENVLVIARQNKQRNILIYFYNLSCTPCSYNYNDINNITAHLRSDTFVTMGIAINTTPQALSDFMNVNGGLPNFKPLILASGEENKLKNINYLQNADYLRPPYIGLIIDDNNIIPLPSGIGKGSLIHDEIKKLLPQIVAE
jgi:hypothetical protein